MKILCPTDMSAHSVIALEYAVNLCNDLDAELHVITAYKVPSKASSLVSIEDKIKKNTQEDLDKVLANITPMIKNDRVPHVKIYRAYAVTAILKYSAANDIDLVVMGTQGDNSLRTILFGSVTKKVAEQSNIPVLAIPEVVKDKLHSDKILLALDNKILENEETFAVPKMIADRLGHKIDILHVTNDKKDFPFDPYISTYLGDTIGEVFIREGDDPVKQIKRYAEYHNIGILIMIRREKSFFENLFTIGDTSAEIAKTNTPLLILPDK